MATVRGMRTGGRLWLVICDMWWTRRRRCYRDLPWVQRLTLVGCKGGSMLAYTAADRPNGSGSMKRTRWAILRVGGEAGESQRSGGNGRALRQLPLRARQASCGHRTPCSAASGHIGTPAAVWNHSAAGRRPYLTPSHLPSFILNASVACRSSLIWNVPLKTHITLDNDLSRS